MKKTFWASTHEKWQDWMFSLSMGRAGNLAGCSYRRSGSLVVSLLAFVMSSSCAGGEGGSEGSVTVEITSTNDPGPEPTKTKTSQRQFSPKRWALNDLPGRNFPQEVQGVPVWPPRDTVDIRGDLPSPDDMVSITSAKLVNDSGETSGWVALLLKRSKSYAKSFQDGFINFDELSVVRLGHDQEPFEFDRITVDAGQQVATDEELERGSSRGATKGVGRPTKAQLSSLSAPSSAASSTSRPPTAQPRASPRRCKSTLTATARRSGSTSAPLARRTTATCATPALRSSCRGTVASARS